MKQLFFIRFATLIGFAVLGTAALFGQTSTFNYQGKLNDAGSPANGTYEFQFKLFDAASGGNQIGQTVTGITITVSNGLYEVPLDFGVASFDGSDRYVEVGIRAVRSSENYSPLTPRSAVLAVPYSIKSLQAENASSAATANNSASLGGVPAGQFVQTTDSRMTDARQPLGGSGNYIQNTQNLQPNAGFNISGEGKADKFNAAAQYEIGGKRVLSIAGTDNAFVGSDAGTVTTGGYNVFVGSESGKANTTGFNNSFLGAYSGRSNTTGTNNAFVGANAGLSNNIGGSNAFFGSNAGFSNTSGSSNSFFGNLSGQNNATGTNNSFFGRSSGANVSNATNNAMFGAYAGENTTTGGNSYFGAFTGQKNTVGFSNSFFGLNAGKENTGGSNNTYLGANTGQSAGALGSSNTFVGANAGQGTYFGAVNGSNNVALGFNAKVAGGVSNAAAIGVNAFATQDNSMVLGTFSTKVAIPGGLDVTKAVTLQDDLNVANQISGGSLNIGNGVLYTTFEGGYQRLKMPNGVIEASVEGGLISGSSGNFDGYVKAEGFAWRKFPSVGAANQKACYYQNGLGVTLLAPCSSSIRYKEDVQDFTSGLDAVDRLRPVTYTWKLNGQRDVGFIAEEVNEIEPLFNNFNEKGQVEGVRYELLTTVLVNAIKEQQKQIKRQQEQIEELRSIVCSGKGVKICGK